MVDIRTLYKPAQFFLIAFIFAWFFWFVDAYFSWNGGSQVLQGLLIFLGICGPVAAALIMFWQTKCPELWSDYKDRLVSLRRIDLRTFPVILFLFPAMICIGIGISLLFGKSPDQFTILLSPAVMTLPALTGIFLAPALEELGWRGYGVDSLRSRFSLFGTFSLLWPSLGVLACPALLHQQVLPEFPPVQLALYGKLLCKHGRDGVHRQLDILPEQQEHYCLFSLPPLGRSLHELYPGGAVHQVHHHCTDVPRCGCDCYRG